MGADSGRVWVILRWREGRGTRTSDAVVSSGGRTVLANTAPCGPGSELSVPYAFPPRIRLTEDLLYTRETSVQIVFP